MITYGDTGTRVAEAYGIVSEFVGVGKIQGITGSFADGSAKPAKWPDQVKTAADALRLMKMPDELPETVLENLADIKALYDVRKSMSTFPSSLRVITNIRNPEVRLQIQRKVFEQTGVLVDFATAA